MKRGFSERALPAVEAAEDVRDHLSGELAADHLHLDHVRASSASSRGGRGGEPVGEVEYPNSGQGRCRCHMSLSGSIDVYRDTISSLARRCQRHLDEPATAAAYRSGTQGSMLAEFRGSMGHLLRAQHLSPGCRHPRLRTARDRADRDVKCIFKTGTRVGRDKAREFVAGVLSTLTATQHNLTSCFHVGSDVLVSRLLLADPARRSCGWGCGITGRWTLRPTGVPGQARRRRRGSAAGDGGSRRDRWGACGSAAGRTGAR
jgi:hypothetical protein